MSRGLANKKQDSLLQGFDKSGSIGNTAKGKEIGGRGGGGGGGGGGRGEEQGAKKTRSQHITCIRLAQLIVLWLNFNFKNLKKNGLWGRVGGGI